MIGTKYEVAYSHLHCKYELNIAKDQDKQLLERNQKKR